MSSMILHILGCGSATPTTRHLPSCQVVDCHNDLFMIDCGEGAQIQLKRMKMKMSRLSHIFISHLHGDHCFGLVGLISTLALQGKMSCVTVHTFKEGIELFKSWTDFFCRELPFELRYNEITPRKEVIFEDNSITVSTFPLLHRVPAAGFLFREKPKRRHIKGEAVKDYNVPHYVMNDLRDGKDFVTPDGRTIPNKVLTDDADSSISYAYCSDTRFSRRVISAVHGVDWLYHEATYADEHQLMAKNRYHSTASQAATVARDAEVKRLVLGHFSKRYLDESPLLEQAQAIFPNTILADEGMSIDLEKDLKNNILT